MRLKGMRIVYLIGPGFEDLEFYVPLMRLKEEGADVVVAGLKAGEELIGKGGLTGRAEVSVADLKAEDFDAIVIPGGWAPDKLRRYDAVKKLVRDFYEQGKVVAMICHAA